MKILLLLILLSMAAFNSASHAGTLGWYLTNCLDSRSGEKMCDVIGAYSLVGVEAGYNESGADAFFCVEQYKNVNLVTHLSQFNTFAKTMAEFAFTPQQHKEISMADIAIMYLKGVYPIEQCSS